MWLSLFNGNYFKEGRPLDHGWLLKLLVIVVFSQGMLPSRSSLICVVCLEEKVDKALLVFIFLW